MKKDIYRYITDASFAKLYSRNATLFIVVFFQYYGMKENFRNYGFHYKSLNINKQGFMEAYWHESIIKKIKSILLRRLSKSKSIKEYFGQYAYKGLYDYLKITRQIGKKYEARKNWSFEELISDYDKIFRIQTNIQSAFWLIFCTDIVIEFFIEQHLGKVEKARLGFSIPEYTQAISFPLKKTAVMLEQEELLKIAAKGKSLKNQLEKHCKKWCWFPCYNPSDKPYSLNHYFKRIRNLSSGSASEQLKLAGKQALTHRQTYRKFFKALRNQELRQEADLINTIAYYRERRNDIRREGLYEMGKFFRAIASKFSITTELLCYATPEEIKTSLLNRRLTPAKSELLKRKQQYVFFGDKDRFAIFSDKNQCLQIAKLASAQVAKSQKIVGKSVSPGKVIGKAYVINDIKKLQVFKKGDILVASMTAPDYVVAMKKAAAIVTDEGGLTSHAAIVSRELKTPCIVGTKIATKILKDGDLIEVDANKGIVRRLK